MSEEYYKHKKIAIYEYLPPELYFYLQSKGWLWKAWANIDKDLIITDGIIRDRYGKLYINTYMFDNKPETARTASGVRIDYNIELMKYLPKKLSWYKELRQQQHEKELITGDKAVGTNFSLHRTWKASDKIFEKVEAAEVREDIIKQPENFPGITCIELNVSWLHTDTRNHKRELYGIKLVNRLIDK